MNLLGTLRILRSSIWFITLVRQHLPQHLLVIPCWENHVVNPSQFALMRCDSCGTASPNYLEELLAGHPLQNLLHIVQWPFAYPHVIRQANRERDLLNADETATQMWNLYYKAKSSVPKAATLEFHCLRLMAELYRRKSSLNMQCSSWICSSQKG